MLLVAGYVAGFVSFPLLAWLVIWLSMRIDHYDPYNDSE